MSEFDMYLDLEILSSVFGLNFEVDFSNLVLKLTTSDKLPIIIWSERGRARNRISDNRLNRSAQYPILFDRNKSFLNGGFLDYSYSGQLSSSSNIGSNAGIIFGAEVLYGDIQGSFTSDLIDNNIVTSFQSWRYRFVPMNMGFVNQVFAGTVTGDAPTVSSFKGLRFTNTPLIPDRTFDEFILDDTTVPDADVELLINGALVDFTKADETGRYSFPIALTYGVNDIKVVIYGPNGELLESERRIDIPYNYVPKGSFRYDTGVGYRNSGNLFQFEDDFVTYFTSRFSLFRSMTNSLSLEHIKTIVESKTIFTTEASLRLRRNLLFNLKATPGYNYRVDGYIQSNRGLYLRAYGGYTAAEIWSGRSGMNHDYGTTTYVPVRIGLLSLGLRASADLTDFDLFKLYRFNSELNLRYRRIGTRFGVRDFYRDDKVGGVFNNRQIYINQIYSFPTSRDYPSIIRGLYTRVQFEFSENLDRVQSFDVNLSKSVLTRGRLQLNWQRNLRIGANSFYITFSYDFRGIRSNSAARINQNDWSASQTFRGSVSLDTPNQRVWFTNRNMTGYAAISPIMYVDDNQNGHFDDGDTRVTDNAVRVLGSGSRVNRRGSHVAITQLQPYYRYDIEIVKSELRDPFLMSALDNFSIITDPNQYKRVEIPMVRTGLIDGEIVRTQRDGEMRGIAGLRLNLKGIDNDYSLVQQTFMDGSFYMFGIPPGEYELSIDPNQLAFMNVSSNPAVQKITIRSLPDGDFVQGLRFELIPVTAPVVPDAVEPTPVTRPEITAVPQQTQFVDTVQVVTPEPVVAVVDTVQVVTPEPVAMIADTVKIVTPEPVVVVADTVQVVIPEPVAIVADTVQVVTPEPVSEPVLRVIDQTPDNYTTYELQVGAYDTERYARSIALRYSQRTGYQFVVVYNPVMKKHTIRLQNITNYELVRHIQGILQRTYGIEDSFITSEERENNLSITVSTLSNEQDQPQQTHIQDTIVENAPVDSVKDSQAPINDNFHIQVGSFSSEIYAHRVAQNYKELAGIDFAVVFNPAVGRHTVRVIGIQTLAEARRLQAEIVQKLGITDSFVIQN